VKRLLPRTQQKQLSLQRSNPSEIDDDDDDAYDDIDLQIAYRRPTLIPCDDQCQSHDEDELSDYVLVRLAVARAKAMKLYKEA
jgi:hypothetical protein